MRNPRNKKYRDFSFDIKSFPKNPEASIGKKLNPSSLHIFSSKLFCFPIQNISFLILVQLKLKLMFVHLVALKLI